MGEQLRLIKRVEGGLAKSRPRSAHARREASKVIGKTVRKE
ncbi:hypothetical protein [Pirellulimonas nuda]|nr:hypothetical protein [Pirellulimonas nuda]